MRRRKCAGGLIAVVTVLVAAIATARGQTPQPTFRSTIDLVQVDVVVVDKNGDPVRGLGASDFALFDRKQPRPISVFEEVVHAYPDHGSAPAWALNVKKDVADNRTAQSQRLIVLVIDDLHIYRERTDRARDLAKQIIAGLGPGASMALLFTSGDHSTQVTEDRAELLAAADTLKGGQSWRRPHEANDTQVMHGGIAEQSADTILAKLSAVGSGQDFFDNMTQFKTLQDAARLVGVNDVRRKAFVLLSEGIGKDLRGVFGGEITPCELNDPKAACYHEMALLAMMESLRRSNVATYAIDPRGKVTSQDLAQESFPAPKGMLATTGGTAADDDPAFRWNNPVRQAQDGLSIVSEASGGFAVTDTDDFTSGLSHIIEDLDHYYLLGFYPADTKGKNYRPLDVKVPAHPEWTLRFRKGYMPGGATAPPKNADPLLSGVLPKTDLPLRLSAVSFPASAITAPKPHQLARVMVTLEVTAPAAALREADGKLRDDLTYQVLVADTRKTQVASKSGHETRLVLDAGAGSPSRETVSYEIQTSVELAPGSYQIRASASSAKLTKGGSAYLTIDVPDFSAASLVVSGFALGYAEGARVPVASETSRAGARGSVLTALPFAPTLDREFASTDRVRVYFEVARKNPSDLVRMTAAIVDVQDRVVASSDHQVSPNGRGQLDVTFTLAGLPPGPYRLRVSATEGRMSAEREIGIAVR